MNATATKGIDSESEVQQHTRTNLEEVIEVNMNEAYITNTIIHTESNVAYSTPAVHNTVPHDYDYMAL